MGNRWKKLKEWHSHLSQNAVSWKETRFKKVSRPWSKTLEATPWSWLLPEFKKHLIPQRSIGTPNWLPAMKNLLLWSTMLILLVFRSFWNRPPIPPMVNGEPLSVFLKTMFPANPNGVTGSVLIQPFSSIMPESQKKPDAKCLSLAVKWSWLNTVKQNGAKWSNQSEAFTTVRSAITLTNIRRITWNGGTV